MPVALAAGPAGPSASTVSHDDLSRKRRLFRAFESNKKDELNEAQLSRRYYHGKQWTDEELRALKRRNQPAITDNRIGRKIDFLVGIEQRLRRDPKAFPRTPKHEHDADIATACLRFVCDESHWDQMASDGTHDGMVSGVGVIGVMIENTRNGLDPVLKRCDVDRFFYDPRSVRPDFSDARYMGLHLWMDTDEAKEQWPRYADKLEDMMDRDGGLSAMKAEEDRSEQWGDFEQRRVRVVEFWERRPYNSALMNTTAMTPAASMPMSAWYYCKFSGDIELESGWSPYLDEDGTPDVPYVAWSPYVDEKGIRYGVIRNMRSLQDEVNHRRSKFLHLVNVRQTFGKEGSIEDLQDFKRQLSRPDGHFKLTGNGEWGKDVGIIDQSLEIKGQAELLAQSQASLENLGPNPGLIGKGGGIADQSGRAILAQRDSGMTELSPVFDRVRDWKLRVYRKIWNNIRRSWTQERIIAITDELDSPKFLMLNQYQMDPMTGQISASNVVSQMDVDIIIDEGPDVITMQEELLQVLSSLGPGVVPPKVLIELSNAPNKEKLLALIDQASAPPPEMVEMQQRMAKLEEALKAATVDKTVAETENKRADSLAKLQTAMVPMQAMAAFPVHYSEPTIEELALNGFLAQPAASAPPGPPQINAPAMPPGAPPDIMPPEEGMMPGGLPISQQAAGI